MSLDLLGDLTAEDAVTKRLLFDKGEVVEFVGKDTRVDEFKGHIYIKTQILSGINAGKDYDVMIAGGDHEATRKRRAAFFFMSGFWTPDELKSKQFQLSRLVGRKFQGKASKVTESKDGEKYQNIDDIKDLGEVPASEGLSQNVGF